MSIRHSGGGYGGRLGKGSGRKPRDREASRKAPHIIMYRNRLDASIDESKNAPPYVLHSAVIPAH